MPRGVVAPASEVTLLARGLFGQRRLATWESGTGTTWLLSPEAGGQWHLLLTHERQMRSLRLATRPDPVDELAPRLDMR